MPLLQRRRKGPEPGACHHLAPHEAPARPGGGSQGDGERDEAARAAQERAVDRGVALELERLAQASAWEQLHPAPVDPAAARLVLRTDRAPDGRHLVLSLARGAPEGEEFRLEVHKRLGS